MNTINTRRITAPIAQGLGTPFKEVTVEQQFRQPEDTFDLSALAPGQSVSLKKPEPIAVGEPDREAVVFHNGGRLEETEKGLTFTKPDGETSTFDGSMRLTDNGIVVKYGTPAREESSEDSLIPTFHPATEWIQNISEDGSSFLDYKTTVKGNVNHNLHFEFAPDGTPTHGYESLTASDTLSCSVGSSKEDKYTEFTPQFKGNAVIAQTFEGPKASGVAVPLDWVIADGLS